jgi:hypothetical protein
LDVAAWTPGVRARGIAFPRGYRISIPAALRALATTVLPGLLEDRRLAAFADPDEHPRRARRFFESELDAALAAVLAEPLSLAARARLGAAFEREGLERCAREQLGMVADLGEGPGCT